MDAKQTVLIAGGAGFIGSHLAERLISRGKRVIIVDNLVTGSLDNLSTVKNHPDFVFFKKDVVYHLRISEKLDFVYHLASLASPNPKSEVSYLKFPLETIAANTQGTVNLLDLAVKNQAKFLFASTSEVYGNPQVHPQTEDYFGNVNPFSLRACYDESKRLGETIVRVYISRFGADARVARIFNTYGPRMNSADGRVVVNFINQALRGEPITVYGDGSYTRSFCYVDDLVDGLIKAMEMDQTRGEVFNLGNDEEISIRELAKVVKMVTGSKSRIVFGPAIDEDVVKRRPDITKARQLLGWRPKISLEEGLQKMLAFYQEKAD